MAIKLSGSLSRKLPIQGIPYSSENFSAGIEVEINSAEAGEVQARLAGLYTMLSQAIDAQIVAVGQMPGQIQNGQAAPVGNATTVRPNPIPVQQQQPVASQRNGYATGRNRIPAATSNGTGNGRRVNATEAQCRAIFAICKSQGIDMAGALADFNVADPKDLHVKDASRLIDQLKNGNGTTAQ